jgi:rod shape-determining protein MreC
MAGGFKLAKGRGMGTAQASLVACGVIAIIIVLLGKAESPIFNTARAKFTDWAEPLLETVRAPLSSFQSWVDGLGTAFTVYRENIRLRQENAELRKWQEVALSLEQRVHRYELLVNAIPDPQLPSVAARVIGQSNRPFIKTMILSAGKDVGIRPGEAVLDDRGLVGRVYLSGEKTAWVLLLTDLNSHVPVVIQPSHRRAILTGDNSPTPFLELDLGEGAVKKGDRVFSSGDGGLLPPDLPIGQVVADRGALRVAMFADPDASDYVHIVDYTPPAEPSPGAVTDNLPALAPVTPTPKSQPSPNQASTAPKPTVAAAPAKPANPQATTAAPPATPPRSVAQTARAAPPPPASGDDEEEDRGAGEE